MYQVSYFSVYVLLSFIQSLVAEPVTPSTFSISGDEGDYITGHRNYAYTTAVGDKFTAVSGDNLNYLFVTINGHNGGDWWSVEFSAARGKKPEKLTPGKYLNATRALFNDDGYGLYVSGNGRGCNRLFGSFVINDLSFGPKGEVNRLDATFEQHCEGDRSAARGHIRSHSHIGATRGIRVQGVNCNDETKYGNHMCYFKGKQTFFVVWFCVIFFFLSVLIFFVCLSKCLKTVKPPIEPLFTI